MASNTHPTAIKTETLRQKAVHEETLSVPTLLLLAQTQLSRGGSAALDALANARLAVRAAKEADVDNLREAQAVLGITLVTLTHTRPLPPAEASEMQSEAEDLLSDVPRDLPLSLEANYHWALLRANQRRHKAALVPARAALAASDGKHAPAWALLALILTGMRQFSSALAIVESALLETAVATSTQGGLLLRIKAYLMMRLGRTSLAMRVLSERLAALKTREESPSRKPSPAGKREMDAQRCEVWGDLCQAFIAQDKLTDAKECWAQIHDSHDSALSAQTHYLSGLISEAEGNLEEATKSFEQANALCPTHGRAQRHLGAAFRRAGQPESLVLAKTLLLDGLRVMPQDHLAWYHLGLVYTEMGLPVDAERALRRSVHLVVSAPVLPFSVLPAGFGVGEPER